MWLTKPTVCQEWHDPDVFCGWYVKNKIKGWDMEKDILQTVSGGVYKQYSPENCCFVPKHLNQWFTSTRRVCQVRKTSSGYSMPLNISVLGKRTRVTLCADSLDDLHEQFYLFKDMHLERQVDRMKSEWKQICDENPNSPEIHPPLFLYLITSLQKNI